MLISALGGSQITGRHLLRAGVWLGVVAVVVILGWTAVTAAGVPDLGARHLTRGAVMVDSGLLVFREGLEAILVLAAITASLVAGRWVWGPIAGGAAIALTATVATWVVVVAVISAVAAPELYVQAVTGLLAIVVLLVIMNWFFHRIYWTAWIGHHNRRRRRLTEQEDHRSSIVLGLGLLGFTAVYREGFEVVLFLQNLRLQAGSATVLAGVGIGMALTLVVGALTFVAHHRLPYKRMLVLTGVLLGVVLVVMVGESAQELQLAGWLHTTTIGLPVPPWMSMWFAVFPTIETLTAQALAALVVLGSYLLAEEVRVRRPRRLAVRAATSRPRRAASRG